MKFPKILFAHSDASASTWYRLVMPAEALARAGYPVRHGHIGDIPDRALMQFDAIVVSRVGSSLDQVMESIEGLQRLGKRVFVDYDDDLLHLPEHNPAYGADTSVVEAVARAADGVIVTNTALASVFKPLAKRIAIVPNYVCASGWPTPQRDPSKIVIGLTGSPSHREDWRIIAEPMQAIRAKYPHVEFLVAGFLPDYLRALVTDYVDWVDIRAYPALINRIDIGLCPLIDDQFNRKKTPIKALELGLAGAAVVASPTQYLSVVKGKGTIARTEEEWFAGTERYIVDSEARQRDAESLRRYVLKQDIDSHVRTVVQVYTELYREST